MSNNTEGKGLQRRQDDPEEVMKDLQNKNARIEPVEDGLQFKVLSPRKNASDTKDVPKSTDQTRVIPEIRVSSASENTTSESEEESSNQPRVIPQILITSPSGNTVEEYTTDTHLTVPRKNLFRRASSRRTPPYFPSNSRDFNSSKSKRMTLAKSPRRPLFSMKPSTDQKKNFADFTSESEEESTKPQILSIFFGSNKKGEQKSQRESMPTMDIDDWKNLPSSTMLHLPEYYMTLEDEDEIECNEYKDKSCIDEVQIHENKENVQIDKSGVGENESSSDGSEWDSPRQTRHTIRQTCGSKLSLSTIHAFVFEHKARRKSAHGIATMKKPTEFLDTNDFRHEAPESSHESSIPQAEVEAFLQEMSNYRIESGKKLDEKVKKKLEPKPRHPLAYAFFHLPDTFFKRGCKRQVNTASKPKRRKYEPELPEGKEIRGYMPSKRYKPRNASWVSKTLYKYLDEKLKPKYGCEYRIRAERLVQTICEFIKQIPPADKVAPQQEIDDLKTEMALRGIVKTHADFYKFLRAYIPKEVCIKVIPDKMNDLPLPRNGIYSDILDPRKE